MDYKRYILSFFYLIVVFALVSYIISAHEEYLKSLIYGNEKIGILVYIILGIIATVIAPLSSMPLVPVMSLLYGWFLTGIFSIVSWGIG